MNKTQLMNNMSRTFHKAALKLKKHSPEILVVAGVVGTVGSAVMACKATLKVNEVLDEAKENIEKIHEATEHGATEAGLDYSVEDSKKDLFTVYVQTGVKMAKLYGPAVIVGGLSVGAILTGHNITRKRNVALAAAYTAVDKSFKEYRGRVVERFGEALDKELRYNIKAKEVEEIVVNEDGTESIVKTTVEVADQPDYSEYSVVYDNGCKGWTKDPDFNKTFLIQQQRYANDLLQSRGYVFLNEVYEMLGVPRTKTGQIVGWVYDEDCPNGDNYIDFGIFDTHREKTRDFLNGYERTIILDFNVDGNILDLI